MLCDRPDCRGSSKSEAMSLQEFERASSEFSFGIQIVSMEGPAARAIPWVARALIGRESA